MFISSYFNSSQTQMIAKAERSTYFYQGSITKMPYADSYWIDGAIKVEKVQKAPFYALQFVKSYAWNFTFEAGKLGLVVLCAGSIFNNALPVVLVYLAFRVSLLMVKALVHSEKNPTLQFAEDRIQGAPQNGGARYVIDQKLKGTVFTDDEVKAIWFDTIAHYEAKVLSSKYCTKPEKARLVEELAAKIPLKEEDFRYVFNEMEEKSFENPQRGYCFEVSFVEELKGTYQKLQVDYQAIKRKTAEECRKHAYHIPFVKTAFYGWKTLERIQKAEVAALADLFDEEMDSEKNHAVVFTANQPGIPQDV